MNRRHLTAFLWLRWRLRVNHFRKAGAANAALLAVRILATTRPELREKLRDFVAEQTRRVRDETLP